MFIVTQKGQFCMNLYEIKRDLANAIDECVDKNTGLITNPERIEKLQMDLAVKRENIALYIKNTVANINAIDAEIKSFNSRKRVLTAKLDWLKQYLSDDLQGQKFSTPKVAISFRKSEVLQVNSYDSIPKEYLIPQEPKVNKMALKKLVKSGAVFNGVELITNQNLIIK